ncbi:2'-5' RNA ligase family protein [Ramlibacter rhizophilus]|nr:2'-5' RNA ligase family protein [Ramlibacter rhizophilus]
MLNVVALPRWRAGDAERLQAWRVKHQPGALRLPAHVPLVQSEHALADADLIEHVRAVAARVRPFTFEFSYALPLMWDGQSARVLLMPEAGAAALWSLYRNLYSGRLAAWLPTTSTFVPHITLGSFSMPEQALALSDQWNASEAPLRGEVTELSVMRLSGPRVQWVTEVPLQGLVSA